MGLPRSLDRGRRVSARLQDARAENTELRRRLDAHAQEIERLNKALGDLQQTCDAYRALLQEYA